MNLLQNIHPCKEISHFQSLDIKFKKDNKFQLPDQIFFPIYLCHRFLDLKNPNNNPPPPNFNSSEFNSGLPRQEEHGIKTINICNDTT